MKRRSRAQLAFGFLTNALGTTPLSRATASRSRKIEAPAPKPWECAVLAVDTARVSGWCISVAGKRIDSGEVDTLNDATVAQIVENAIGYALVERLPLVLVLEAPYTSNAKIVAALGQARERWLAPWRCSGEALSRVVFVQPSQWRAPVLGRDAVSLPRAEVRAREMALARSLVKGPIGEDEAPAILIARWASHAAIVGRAIGKRAAKRSLRVWTAKGQ